METDIQAIQKREKNDKMHYQKKKCIRSSHQNCEDLLKERSSQFLELSP